MITEELQGYGSWSLNLSYPPGWIYDNLRKSKFATLYVVWGRIEHTTAAEIEARAEYAGVVLTGGHNTEQRMLTMSGHGLAWWLGAIARQGPTLGTDFEVDEAKDPSDVLTEVWEHSAQNNGLTLGTLTNPPADAPNAQWQGLFNYKTTLRQVLDQLATDCNCSWRVNVDGTIDFGPADDLFNTSSPMVVGVYPLDPKSMNTGSTVQNMLTNLWLETDLGEANSFVADIVKGYKDNDYAQSGIYETSGFLSEEEAIQAIEALLNARSTPDDSAVIVFNAYHRAQEWIEVGDSVDVYDRYALWEPSGYVPSIFGHIPVKRLVVNSKTWMIDDNMSFFMQLPDSETVFELTPWVQSGIRSTIEPTITFVCGDETDTVYNQIAGSMRITTPVPDLLEDG